jgi:hypothetical protein
MLIKKASVQSQPVDVI